MGHMPAIDMPDGATAVETTRQVLAGTGLTGGGDLSADRTLAIDTTGVTAGSYTYASLTVNAQGQLTAASSGSIGYLRPEDYGATGDGTTDDISAFDSCVAAAIALNGLAAIKLTAGSSYLVSRAITIEGVRGLHVWGNNAEIVFPSDDASITAADSEHSAQQRRSAFHLRNASHCVFRDIRCRGTGDNMTASGGIGAAFALRRATQTRIERCHHAYGGSLFLQDAVAATSGQGDSIAVSGSTCTLTDAGGAFHAGMVGLAITISGATTVKNNGTFRITSVTSATILTYENPDGAAEASSFRYTATDGDHGSRIIECTSLHPHGYCSAGAFDTQFIGCAFEWPLATADACGLGDAFTIDGTTVTLTDAGGKFKPEHHGRYVKIASATSAANDGVYQVNYVSSTQISYTNASGVAESFTGTWWIAGGEKTGLGAGTGALSVSGTTVTLTAAADSFSADDVGRGVRIAGATTADNNGTFTIEEYVSATEIRFSNSTAASEDYAGVWTVDSYDTTSDSTSESNGSTHGLYAFAGRTTIKVIRCTFRGNRKTSVKGSGTASPIRDVTIDGCTFYECGLAAEFGADDTNEHTSFTFINNTVIDCATQRKGWSPGPAVSVLGAGSATIEGNHFHYTRDAIGSLNGHGIGGNIAVQASRYASNQSDAMLDVRIARNKTTYSRGLCSETGAKIITHAVRCADVGIAAKWNTAGTISVSGSTATLTDSTAIFSSRDIGKTITFVNATSAGNDGSFTILTVPSKTTLTFTNASAVAQALGGTYRIAPKQPAVSSCVIADNDFLLPLGNSVELTRCVGPEVRNNVFGTSMQIQSAGCVSPRIFDNTEIATVTQNAVVRLDSGTSWPLVAGNVYVSRALGTSSGRDVAIGVDGATRVDYPLLGVRGRARPTGALEEVVFAYGSGHVDGDTVDVDGTVYTYKATSPTGNQFNSFAGLVALIDAQSGFSCADYGTGFSAGDVTTQHLRVRAEAQTTSDGTFYVKTSALNPTALVMLRNSATSNDRCRSRGSGSAGPTADKTVIWSPCCRWDGVATLVADEATAMTLLASSYRHVKNSDDAGACEVMQHGTEAGTEEFRWRLG